jgi:hypothetical protein
MKDAQKPDHTSLNNLISRLRDGRFVIPDFQREFEWQPWDIRELMRSILLDYYIGSLLLWKGRKESFQALSCEPVYGYKGGGNPEHIVLDGQQRLTAMYYAFLSPDIALPNRASRFFYFVHVDKFMDEQYDDAFGYDTMSRRWTTTLKDRSAQYANHIFPLGVIGSGGWELPNWVQGYEQYWRDQTTKRAAGALSGERAAHHADNANAFGEHLKEITEQYQVSYIELDQDLAVDRVCDIFTQINSRGVRLDVFDLVNALLKPKGLQLKHMWREAARRLEFVDSGKMNVYILQVMSILRQGYCSPKYLYFLLPGQEKPVRDPDGTRHKEVLVPDTADFEKLWKEAVAALEGAINLLRHPQEFGAISSSFLPYVSILPAFAALQAQVKALPAEKRLEGQRRIRQWYWASVFTNRYSGSVESTSARDFVDVKDWMENPHAEPAFMLEFRTRFRNLDLRREVRRGSSVYNGIFNLLVLQGARDWMTGGVPQHGDLDDHHIVPASWGAEHLKDNLIHSILNRTPLTADTNRNLIGDQLPNVYLKKMIASSGEQTVRAILETHSISSAALSILLRDPFTPDDFEAFIAERQRTFQEAIENLLIKERLDLSPTLRELDGRVERVELGLRDAIARALDADGAALPSHVAQKVHERIRAAAQKNPAMDADNHQHVAAQLEFCDLRELQDTIVAKALWPRFVDRFGNKEMLNTRFGQLAELRNCLRHSRTADEITRKDGEAAILWFEQVLAK